MFIHIGGDTMVRLEDIIGIFDLSAKDSPDTNSYLELAKRANSAKIIDVGELKSFVVTNKALYYSPISSLTLRKRAAILERGPGGSTTFQQP
ncbi:extracellular matrix regulator RemB [Alicyclobacillus sp. SO9]|uniref:extracellular matrix regulator RemB n=1 Tax=Alicyclobacillus sp. SO9 TaxID=2665646 RepID=UPI0018E88CE3|nr:extracellular matrix/biofilm biosynthesis regulator RemA family protein [Alicyclobacillus sp. SO9]QQE78959.1 DUF370 domain-containing protein [Alicyclobacillus sp. SO9]